MIAIMIGAGMGNYFYPLFVFGELAKTYNQKIELIEQYSCHKSRYAVVVDELGFDISRRILYEYGSDGCVRGMGDKVSIDKIREFYSDCRITDICDNDLIFGDNGSIRLKDESIINGFDVILCHYEGFYNKKINQWIMSKRALFSGKFFLRDSGIIYNEMGKFAGNAVGIHVRYFKLIRIFGPGYLQQYLRLIIDGIRKADIKIPIFVFADEIATVKEMISDITGLYYINLPLGDCRRDLYELLLFSKCRYRVVFDTTSFPVWGRVLSEQSVEDDLVLSLRDLGRISWFLGKRALKTKPKSLIYRFYISYVLEKYKGIIKKWSRKLTYNSIYDTEKLRKCLWMEYDFAARKESELLQIMTDAEKESYYEKKMSVNDDLESHIEYLAALHNNNRRNNEFIEDCYIRNVYKNKKDNRIFYIFIRLDAEAFTCVTDYLEDIGIVLTYMGHDVYFVVCNNIEKYANYYQMNIDEEYLNAIKTFKKCRYIFLASFSNIYDQNNTNVFLYKETDFAPITQLKGMKVLYYECKWYDCLRHVKLNADDLKDITDNSDLIYSSHNRKELGIDEKTNYIHIDKESAFKASDTRLRIEDLKETDDWSLNMAKSILAESDKWIKGIR